VSIAIVNNILAGNDDDLTTTSQRRVRDAGYKVLIIDDNEAAAQTIGWMIETDGHETRCAYNGPDALSMAAAYKPDYVFLDIGIPGMDGYEICHMMKALPGLENTVFVAQTGWSDKAFLDRSRDAGFDHHLVKPLELQTLRGILSQKKIF
jgi:CheY-like chemotaxis protein